MTTGEVLHGFRVTRTREIPELEGTLHELEHSKTGAQLCWMERADQNKTFGVAFQTLPEDDTGVFHILEHSVLNGSKRYPVKEPFVELLKSSLNTFLNAMTYPDKTVYPVCSRNDADFMNLARVYADAVFAPAIYTQPNIFRQEGWHYELEEAGKEALYKGVVYNEMKGAMSSVDDVIDSGMNRVLFPQSCYRFNSGGDPEHIPDLTYEQFLSAHRRFYHPSNARIWLDGALDLEAMLEMLDGEYLSAYERREPDFKLTMQEPVSGFREQCYELAPGEAPQGKAHLALGRIVGTWADKERNLALEALCDCLAGSNDAPLKRVVLENRLGQDLRLYLADYTAQTSLRLEVRNTDREKGEEIRALLRRTLEKLASEGLDRRELAASLNRLEFRYREREEPYGLYLGLRSLNAWLYGGDPVLHLTCSEAFAALRKKLESGYFEELLRETMLEDRPTAVVWTLPSATLGEEKRRREAGRLHDEKASWSEERLREVVARSRELNAWQQAPNTAEALSSLPALRLDQIPREPERIESRETSLRDVTVLRRESRSKGVTYLNLYFSLGGLALEELSPAALLAHLLGKLPTARRGAGELQRELKTWLGSLRFGVEVFSRRGEITACRPVLSVRCAALEANLPKAVELIREILLETDFSQDGKVRELTDQYADDWQQNLIQNGHRLAMTRALSHHSAAGAAKEQTGGYACCRLVQAFTKDFAGEKGRFDALELPRRIFRESGVAVSVTGHMEERDLSALLSAFPAGKKGLETASYSLSGRSDEGVEVPAGVSFTSLGLNLSPWGGVTGAARVLAHALSYGYLWNSVRAQGGAYGVGLLMSDSGDAAYYSFRDPNASRSLGVFRSAPEQARALAREEDGQMEKTIIGAVSATERLLSPAAEAFRADADFFNGTGWEYRCRVREEILGAKRENMEALAALLEKLSEEGSTCVVGPAASLEGRAVLAG